MFLPISASKGHLLSTAVIYRQRLLLPITPASQVIEKSTKNVVWIGVVYLLAMILNQAQWWSCVLPQSILLPAANLLSPNCPPQLKDLQQFRETTSLTMRWNNQRSQSRWKTSMKLVCWTFRSTQPRIQPLLWESNWESWCLPMTRPWTSSILSSSRILRKSWMSSPWMPSSSLGPSSEVSMT